ncbi:MAG: anion permease [Acidobacteria bacterium]|nr:MAG: anion permease [Acidobacteriota bacterium]
MSEPVAAAPGWKSAGRWLAPPAVAAAIWALPHGRFDARAWGLLTVFAATIAGLIAQPLPGGAVVLVAVALVGLLRIVPAPQALSGFANPTVWLIVAAFMVGRGFVKTRLGERIAYALIGAFGGTALRLGYSLVLADLVLAPAIASNTARAGGVLYPITRSVARAFDSEPGPTARRLGAFLMKAVYQGDLVVSAMFLTAMTGNPLVAEMARQSSGVAVTWAGWALAAALPGAAGIAVVPLLVYRLCPPEVGPVPEARGLARSRLAEMGPMSRAEKRMLGVAIAMLVLWATGTWHDISSTTVALAGVAALLLLDVLQWSDIQSEGVAWDAFVWFGGLVMMAEKMNEAGLLSAFVAGVAPLVGGWRWPVALACLLLLYMYAHYFFASLTAHVTALFPAFFALACARGAPPLLAALALGFFSSINAAMTHYGTGPAVVFYGAGYLSQAEWWKIGFIMSLAHATLWLAVGFPWWKALGLW